MQETEDCKGETDVPHVVQGQTETDVLDVVQGQTDVMQTRLCFERHRVDKCLNFVPNLAQSPDDALFNKILKTFFIITLFLAVKDLISYSYGGGRGTILEVCAAFVIVLVLVWTKTMMKNISSALARTEEVKTNPAFIQHV